MKFKLQSDFKPTGDQPTAIKQLVEGLNDSEQSQTLLGVTGSGKTFTIANVIQEVNRPTLVLSHNKTLAAQLFSEFKQFFPENAVEYFVSYYDYYQPEAYIPSSGTYIEKDLSINEEIEKYRLSDRFFYSHFIKGRANYLLGNYDLAKKNLNIALSKKIPLRVYMKCKLMTLILRFKNYE